MKKILCHQTIERLIKLSISFVTGRFPIKYFNRPLYKMDCKTRKEVFMFIYFA